MPEKIGCSERPPHLFGWCAKVLMIRMHRPRHEALSASSPGGERGGTLRADLGSGCSCFLLSRRVRGEWDDESR